MIDHRELPEYYQVEVEDVIARRRRRALANLGLRVTLFGGFVGVIVVTAALIAGQMR